MRFRDLLKETKFENRFNLIFEEAQQNFLRDLGKNDYYHSNSIEAILDKMVPDNVKLNKNYFDDAEIFFLLTSIYLHDIGRRTHNDYHEIESYNQIKEYPSRFYLSNHEAEAVAQICAAHAHENDWPISRNNPNYGILGYSSNGRTFNLQRLGALLRIGDELDNSFIRARGIESQSGSIRNIIRDINPIYDKRIIEIQASPNSWQEYYTLVKVRDYTQTRLEEVTKYLSEVELDYYQIWLDPEDFMIELDIDISSESSQNFTIKITDLLQTVFTKIELYEKFDNIELPIVAYSNSLGTLTSTGIIPTLEIDLKKSEEFIAALDALKKKNYIDIGLVITKKSYNENISKMFNDNGIKISTYSNLLDGSFNIKGGLQSLIKELSESEVFKKKTFIESSGTLENEIEILSLENYLNNWLSNPKEMQITLLGDFGVGKTTLMDHLTYNWAENYIKNNHKYRIPINIKLKEFSNYSSIESLVTSKLINSLNMKIDYKTFQSLNNDGRFVIILDGFDEIPALTNVDRVLSAFREIDKIVVPNTKIILSCRTHFFKTKDDVLSMQKTSKLYEQINQKYGYKIIYIKDFSKSQVSEYVSKWDYANKNMYTDIIEKVYNLEDLSHRPVLLNMIVKTIPQLSNSKDMLINSSALYSIYTNYWLERDDWRTEIKIEERKKLTIALSDYYFVNSIGSLNYKKLNNIITPKQFSNRTYKSEIIDYELRTCNFLRRDEQGNYSFVHKSFMEYFLASELENDFFNSKTKILVNWYLPSEEQDNKKAKIATNETENFFLELSHKHLLQLTSENMIELIQNDVRGIKISLILIERLSLENFGLVLAYIILNLKWELNISKVFNCFAKSNNLGIALDYIKKNIKKNFDQSFAVLMVEAFKNKLEPIYIDWIHDIEKEIDVIKSKKDSNSLNLNDPTALIREKIELEFLAYVKQNPGLDPNKLDKKYAAIKTKFYKEYKQRENREKKKAEKERNKNFSEYLKRKKRKK